MLAHLIGMPAKSYLFPYFLNKKPLATHQQRDKFLLLRRKFIGKPSVVDEKQTTCRAKPVIVVQMPDKAARLSIRITILRIRITILRIGTTIMRIGITILRIGITIMCIGTTILRIGTTIIGIRGKVVIIQRKSFNRSIRANGY